MTSDERRDAPDAPDSLADQAAAWVPPWARQAAVPADRSANPPDRSANPPDSAAAEPAADPVEPAEDVADEVDVDEVDGASARSDSADPVSSAAAAGPVDVPPLAAPETARSAAEQETADAPALSDSDELRAALEAILLVVDEPVAEIVLAQVLEQPINRVAAMLEQLSADYTEAGHGFDLRRAAGGWRLYTRPEYATYVERFVLNGQAVRLTQAALETLAVVAYKQPVTRSRISAIRGVNCDGVIRTLVARGLVEECGSEPDSGAFLYRTTTLFLEKLGLNTADELPPLAPFLPDDLEEIADAPR
ncbi:SMC-Scp complex subunit ScpB [Micromonospora sp. NBC_01699]|uniref:SMC-Scp complex subunit ScpB n=1 Tax=Micromonospora sp. NBC_01699 TaxID=2975984 RepID=UPI002E3007FB|nr:SMC-Scp complex subunit ScpB [Micromonospora sp. NBC_01699]